jgi:signal transduction histidine kinase
VAVYYVVAEALTNTAKHANAFRAAVYVEAVAGELRISVCDDGRGGADFTGGTGLVGLKDRVEALGGRIALHSPHGAGTTLRRVELPPTATLLSGETRGRALTSTARSRRHDRGGCKGPHQTAAGL